MSEDWLTDDEAHALVEEFGFPLMVIRALARKHDREETIEVLGDVRAVFYEHGDDPLTLPDWDDDEEDEGELYVPKGWF